LAWESVAPLIPPAAPERLWERPRTGLVPVKAAAAVMVAALGGARGEVCPDPVAMNGRRAAFPPDDDVERDRVTDVGGGGASVMTASRATKGRAEAVKWACATRKNTIEKIL
jgi:hypothetical protein